MGLKDWIGARYEPDTDSIKGCRRNTLVWHHEDRHRQQFNSEYLDKINSALYLIVFEGGSFGFFTIIMLFGQLTSYTNFELFQFGLKTIGLMAFPYLLLQLMLEADAWIYTFQKLISEDYTQLA